MKRDASHELDIKMNHVPREHTIDHFNLSSAETTSTVFYSGVSFRKDLIEVVVTKSRELFIDFVESGLRIIDFFTSPDSARKIGEFVAKGIESFLNTSCCLGDRLVVHGF